MEDFENEIDTELNDDKEVSSKLNSIWLGLIVGILAPVLAFLMFYESSFTKVSFDYFIHYSIRVGALINILTISLIPNFLIFSLFIWRRHYKSAKGIVIASASLTVLLFAAKLFIFLYFK